MGYFTDYVLKTRQEQQPVVQPQQPLVTVPVQQPQQPQVDTENAINSIAEMLGPTPAEREARERRALESRAKMSAWAGLFDGLRQFGNLYSVYKGATPQQLSSPYQAIDNEINQQRAIADANDNYRRQYATALYNFRRQMAQDQMQRETHQAQLDWYKNRDEKIRQDAELNKLKAVKIIKQKDGSLMKYDPVNDTLEQISESDPLYVEYMQSVTKKNEQQGNAAVIRANKAGGNGGSGRNNAGTTRTTTVDYDENGNKRTTTVTTPNNASGNGGGGNRGKLLPGNQTNKERRGSLLP